MSEVRAKKALGQHFLVDLNIARKICDALSGGVRPEAGAETRAVAAGSADADAETRTRVAGYAGAGAEARTMAAILTELISIIRIISRGLPISQDQHQTTFHFFFQTGASVFVNTCFKHIFQFLVSTV